MPRFDNGEPLSIRRSIIVWLAGGVFGWVLAVVLIYGTIRITSHENVAEDAANQPPNAVATEEKKLQDIAPAAGGTQTTPPTKPETDSGAE